MLKTIKTFPKPEAFVVVAIEDVETTMEVDAVEIIAHVRTKEYPYRRGSVQCSPDSFDDLRNGQYVKVDERNVHWSPVVDELPQRHLSIGPFLGRY